MGAWIETLPFLRLLGYKIVAPRVGAWIETLHNRTTQNPPLSHPVWVRGLKPADQFPEITEEQVAPRVGAWIETPIDTNAL